MSPFFLLVGLGLLFLGVAALILVSGNIVKERSEVAASLATIEALSGPVPSGMRQQYDRPFVERVARPAQARLAGIARTVSGGNWAKKTARKLDMAGNPPGWGAERMLAAKALLALIFFAVVATVLWITQGNYLAILWGGVFGIAAFFIPDLVLFEKARKRSEAMARALPDSIDLLTISVESGLAFDAAMAQVSHNTDGPLAEEFTRVLQEIQIGSGRSDALRGLAERTDVEDLRIFLNSMIQAEKLGIPIADVLRVQAGEMRLKRSQRTEERAMKLPVKLVFPVMLCIMPALFIVILGPAALSIVDQLAS